MEYKGACKEMEKSAAIFQPIRLGNVEIKNRIEVAAGRPIPHGARRRCDTGILCVHDNLAKSRLPASSPLA